MAVAPVDHRIQRHAFFVVGDGQASAGADQARTGIVDIEVADLVHDEALEVLGCPFGDLLVPDASEAFCQLPELGNPVTVAVGEYLTPRNEFGHIDGGVAVPPGRGQAPPVITMITPSASSALANRLMPLPQGCVSQRLPDGPVCARV